MNTEYAIGHFRLHFESQKRRRWFVAFCYAVFVLADLALNFLGPKLNQGIILNLSAATGAWIICTAGTLFVALFIVLSWIAGDMRARGDERETHRRDHAHYVAYYCLGYGLISALFAGYFRGADSITTLLPRAVRGVIMQLPYVLLVATGIVYITLPKAILLWTEPDMEAAQ